MRELARTWALLTGVISAAALLAAPGAWASHDAACQLLGTGAQRPKSVACNPRQNCFNATPGNPACNAAPTSGECPGTETYDPRQECLAKLPALPAVSITRDVHDKQGMKVDANARMRVVEKALPDGLVAPASAGRR